MIYTPEEKLQAVEEYATRQMGRKCLYCQTHDKIFIEKYPNEKKELGYFSSSPAFLYNGEWQHLLLADKNERYKGGYNWRECDAQEHHNYLSIVTGKTSVLDDAEKNAADYMATMGARES